MIKYARLGFVIVCGILLSNCATVTRGTVNQIQVIAEPADADARTSLGHTCRTPCTLTIDRKSEFTVTISKEGYQPASVPVATRIAGSGAAGFAGNIIVGGIIGMAADAATGATLEHFPNPVSVTLEAIRPERGRGRKPLPRTSRRIPAAPEAGARETETPPAT